MTPELATSIIASASRLGISPRDLATVISYETAGTFDPWKAGPTTQWGQHRGLIQWGEPQRQKYGVTQDMPVPAQLQAVERYLTDAGVRPGMGIMDVYSAINAGRVGRYGASDANNGGAPGTVADKVNNQMAGHAAKADQLLGMAQGYTPPQTASGPAPASSPSTAPMGLLAASPEPSKEAEGPDALAMMRGLLAQQQQPQQPQGEAPGLLRPRSQAFPKLRLAAPMQRRSFV
jgi:hypothetical protein